MEIFNKLFKISKNTKACHMKYTNELNEIISLSQSMKEEVFLYMESWKKQYLLKIFNELINSTNENLIIPEKNISEFVSLAKEIQSSVEELSILHNEELSESEKENSGFLEDRVGTVEESNNNNIEVQDECLDDEEELIKAIKKSLHDFDAREVENNYNVFDEKNSLNELVLKNEAFESVEILDESKFCSENKELLEKSVKKLEFSKYDFTNDAMINEIKKSLEDYSLENNALQMHSRNIIGNEKVGDYEKKLLTSEKFENHSEKSSNKIVKKKNDSKSSVDQKHGALDKENIFPYSHHVNSLSKSLIHSPVEEYRVDTSNTHAMKSILKSRQRSISSSSIYHFFQFEHHSDHYKSTPRFSENSCEPSSIIQNIKDKVTFKLTPDYKVISDDSGSLKMSDSYHSTLNHSLHPFNISKNLFNFNSPFDDINASFSKDNMLIKNISLKRSSSLGGNSEVSHKELLSTSV